MAHCQHSQDEAVYFRYHEEVWPKIQKKTLNEINMHRFNRMDVSNGIHLDLPDSTYQN